MKDHYPRNPIETVRSKALTHGMRLRGLRNTDLAAAMGVAASQISVWRASGRFSSQTLTELMPQLGLRSYSEFVQLGTDPI